MNDGKQIEKLVRLIQEALKDFPSTQIFSNYRIENNSGRKREIDVLLKTNINGYEIIIAIECKDYKTPIPVEKIEAFNSKCQRIKGISKKIFVTTHGYQSDSYEAAKDFDIELYRFDEINIQDIIQWFPIKQLKAKYLLKLPYRIETQAEPEDIKKIPQDKELIIHFYDNSPSTTLSTLLWNSVVYKHQRALKAMMLLDFMKNNSNLNYQTITPYTLDCTGIYILGENDKKINITKIKSAIVSWLEEVPAKIIDARNYKKVDNETIAKVITVDAEKNKFIDIVLTKKMTSKYFTRTIKDKFFNCRLYLSIILKQIN